MTRWRVVMEVDWFDDYTPEEVRKIILNKLHMLEEDIISLEEIPLREFEQRTPNEH